MSQKTGIGIFFLAAAVLVLVLFGLSGFEKEADTAYLEILETEGQEGSPDGEEAEKEEPVPEEKEAAAVVCHVCGKVKNPGVYELSEDARVSDFIRAAGGFTKKADREYLNLAEKVEDGEKIYVPSKKETAGINNTEEGKADSSGNAEGDKVNINTAGKEELMTLTGIGEAKADAIITYRETNGSFQTTEELMQIPGIKEGVYQKISDHITT